MVVFELEAIASMTGVCPLGDSSSTTSTSCVYLRACRLNTDPALKVPKRQLNVSRFGRASVQRVV